MRIPTPRAAVSSLPAGCYRWAPQAKSDGITPSSKKGGGGGNSDNPAICARSGYDCGQAGYRSWAISVTCQRRYPNGEFPIGCYS